MLKVKFDAPDVDAMRDADVKQVRMATLMSINTAAWEGMKAGRAEVESVFDSPTPWVVKGVRYQKAKPDRMTATIDLDYWGNKQGVGVDQVLQAEVYGGERRAKRHEVALQRIGVLPAGMGIVPGEAAKLDAYGNMQAGQIVQILAWFRAFGQQGYKANMDDKGRARLGKDKRKQGTRGFEYVAVYANNRGGMHPGIYQKTFTGFGSAVKPVMIFVPMPKYRKRFDFYTVVDEAARRAFDKTWPAALAKTRPAIK